MFRFRRRSQTSRLARGIRPAYLAAVQASSCVSTNSLKRQGSTLYGDVQSIASQRIAPDHGSIAGAVLRMSIQAVVVVDGDGVFIDRVRAGTSDFPPLHPISGGTISRRQELDNVAAVGAAPLPDDGALRRPVEIH